ncbi:MAG: xylulokinase [Firmicutes bacterium]|jgi:xylulokinase|nr:xylulokinase [Bacillota bacterium]
MSGQYLLGIDIGSGACKITLIDLQGRPVYTAAHEYPTYYPQAGWAEQNPPDWYEAVCAAVLQMKEKGFVSSKIAAVCLSAPTHTAVLMDEHFRVLRPAILWTDQRSAPQAERLEREFGQEIFEVTCNRVDPVWTLPQLLWIKENEPQVWHKVAYILFAKDYVRWRLTGTYVTDSIEAVGSMLFDARTKRWSERLCTLVGLSTERLPKVVEPTEVVGWVTAEAARATGLQEGTPVIAGATDTALEVFGAGAVESGQSTIKLATAGRICVITDRACPHPYLFNYPHVVPGRWYPGTGTKSCASSYRWLRDALYGHEKAAALESGANVYELIDQEAARVPVGSEGLLFQPYLLGELSPYGDPYLKGAFFGLTMRHTRAHFARAVLEGVGFSLLDSMSVLEEMGMAPQDLRIIGGGARSPLWRQIISDILGQSLTQPLTADSSFGGALLAGVGIGLFEDAAAAAKQCVKTAGRTEPDMENHARYRALFEIYKEAHDNMAATYRKLSDVVGSF